MDKNYAYVDGSFNPKKNIYGYGGFLIDSDGKRHEFQGSGADPEWVKMRNVAGEIRAAVYALRLARDLGMKSLTLFYDYEGIANWPLGRWKTKNSRTEWYKKTVKRIMSQGLFIIFKHVKGHSGDIGNELADYLAKEAVGL